MVKKQLPSIRVFLGKLPVKASEAINTLTGAFEVLLALLFMMGTQSALFGPVKYAILPQHLRRHELVSGNAWIEMGTFLAILLGTLSSAFLLSEPSEGNWLAAVCLVVVALIGLGTCYLIPSAPPVRAHKVRWQPIRESTRVMKDAWHAKRVFPALVAISLFWFLGTCYLTQLPIWTRQVVMGDETAVSLLLAAFAVGIGLGAWSSSSCSMPLRRALRVSILTYCNRLLKLP